ncbi:MAG: hypothetical protein K2Y37_16315 [Pirellulales bacterium]|nr:hypothetical protein [Pirellulales bacterium]
MSLMLAAPEDPRAFVIGGSIVEGKVTSIRQEEGYRTATVKVTAVCYSPDINVGETFTVMTTDEPPVEALWFADDLIPAMKTGQRSLWAARKYPDGHIVAYYGLTAEVKWPAHVEDQENFTKAKHLTDLTVKITAESTGAARVAKIKELLHEDEPRAIVGWLIEMLGQHARLAKDAELTNYLAAIPFDAAMPMIARVQADTALVDIRADTWRRSPERLKLLQSWMRNPPSLPDTGSIVAHFAHEAQGAVWPQSDLIGLVELAVRDPENDVNFKSFAVNCLRWIPKRYDDDKPAFEWLMKLLVETKEPRLQFAAARTLTEFRLDVLRQGRLERAVNRVGNSDAKKHVDWVIEFRNRRRNPALVQ